MLRLAARGRVVEFAYDSVGASLTVRVEGGAFNFSDNDANWGKGDFSLVFRGVDRCSQSGRVAGGTVVSFEEAPGTTDRQIYRVATTSGASEWESAAAVMSWFVPRA